MRAKWNRRFPTLLVWSDPFKTYFPEHSPGQGFSQLSSTDTSSIHILTRSLVEKINVNSSLNAASMNPVHRADAA
jgi:hypothetical protein